MRKFQISIIIILLLAFALPSVSAAHFIAGFVNNSLDGENSDNYIITLWNPANGVSDNITDIIGSNGNSGANNIYFVDCELLNSPCQVGDTINAKVFNNASNYVTETESLTVTGAGFDAMPDLRLNSLPTVALDSPLNYANLSSSSADLSCTANDLDANLQNLTLYGNWTGWHANETVSISGSSENANFTKSLDQGIYKWSCLATDDLAISSFAQENFTFTVDLTPPNIASVDLNFSGNICGISETLRVNCTAQDSLTGIQNITIEAIKPSGSENHTGQFLSGNTYFSDILLDEIGEWGFNCIATDYSGNNASLSSENLSIHSDEPDLTLSTGDISFSDSNPIENSLVLINATIHNNGCSESNNSIVGFFNGDPEISSSQINGNRTLSIPGLSNITTNVTWNAEIGSTNVFVFLDINNSIAENNETNNKANKTIEVNAWQEFYGNVTIDRLLGDQNNRNLSLWFNESVLSGNVFITDTESDISWNSLLAIGKNTSGGSTTNDFSEIDSLLSMTSYPDSVSNVFTTDGNTPITTLDFFAYQQNISGVPIINSTNSTNFITGILWDSSDDSDSEYDSTEKEDLVFAGEVNKATQGAFGVYDYEIRIPVRLREYYTTETSDIFIYFDLN